MRISRAVIALVVSVSLGACYSGQSREFRNLRLHFSDPTGSLITRSPAAIQAAAVPEGAATWVILRRMCIPDVGSWLGPRDLTVGIAIAARAGAAVEIGKGVLPVEGIRDGDCLQFSNIHIVDPFLLQRNSYRITFSVVQLPAKNAQLLASITKTVVSSAVVAPTLANSPQAKLGTALFDTFVQPAVNEKRKMVEYSQEFEAYEMGGRLTGSPDLAWQTGSIILLPENGSQYSVTTGGRTKKGTFTIDPTVLYVDTNGGLRKRQGTAPAATDPPFTDAPYAVLEIAASLRGSDDADRDVSSALRAAALEIGKSNPDPASSQQALLTLTTRSAQHADRLTTWSHVMMFDLIDSLADSRRALLQDPAADLTLKIRSIQDARAEHRAVIERYTQDGPVATLTQAERLSLARVDSALTDRLNPLLAEARAQEDAAAARQAALQQQIQAQIAASVTRRESPAQASQAVANQIEQLSSAAEQAGKWADVVALTPTLPADEVPADEEPQDDLPSPPPPM